MDKMSSRSEWPLGYEKEKTLKISTVGRKTGRTHTTTIWFAIDTDGRFYIATRDKRRDWVRNARKNPLVDITIRNVTRKMKLVLLKSELEENHVRDLYRKKYALTRVGTLFGQDRSSRSGAFELVLA